MEYVFDGIGYSALKTTELPSENRLPPDSPKPMRSLNITFILKWKKVLMNPGNTMQVYYNPNSPAGQARHLERYLNYLLEHPALSTSFPLNTILKVSIVWKSCSPEMM